jgi:hypothetical protein
LQRSQASFFYLPRREGSSRKHLMSTHGIITMRDRSNILNVIEHHIVRVLDKNWWRCIKDFRYRSNTQWSLGYVLEVLLAGALSGCKTLREVETLSEIYADRVPDTTLHDLMIHMDHEGLKDVLAKGVKQALREHELEGSELPINITAIDGKYNYNTTIPVSEHSEVIGGGGNDEMYRHLALRAMHVSSDTKLYLGQREITSKGSETVNLLHFIDQLKEFYGKTKLLEVISIDAGMVSKSNAQGLIERGLHYIMGIKGSQPTLFGYAQGLFENKLPDCTTEECYNGKQVTRHLSRALVLQPPALGWEHLKELWKVETITLDPVTQSSSSEIRYFATSLAPSRLNNQQVLGAIRAHWGIENNANWCFDVHWKEDSAPWTSRAMPLVSYLRMIAYNIIERLKTRRLKAARNRVLGWKDFFKFFEHSLCRLRHRLEISGEAFPPFIA